MFQVPQQRAGNHLVHFIVTPNHSRGKRSFTLHHLSNIRQFVAQPHMTTCPGLRTQIWPNH